MHIVVPIKQVPETSDVQMDKETGTMIRSGSTAIVNPLDLYAIETALRLKDLHQAKVSVITMGPPSAVKVLKEAVAMGCDEAFHISGKAFGGADTWATSYTLSQAIHKIGAVDLVITGERATDGDTGQVGPAIAAWLDMPVCSYVSSIEKVEKKYLMVLRLIEEGYQEVSIKLPAVFTVVKEIAIPRLPTLKGKKRAMEAEIPIWSEKEIEADMKNLGLKGSPTRVVKIESPEVKRTCTVVHTEDDHQIPQAVEQLIKYLESRKLLSGGVGHE